MPTPSHYYFHLILNRTTKEIKWTEDLTRFSTEEWVFNPNLDAVYGLVPNRYWYITADDVIREMTANEKAAVDAARLSAAKIAKSREIDDNTANLLLAGFTHNGHTFAMSQVDQLHLDSIKNRITAGLLSNGDFPKSVALIDGSSYQVPNIQAFANLYNAYSAAFDTRIAEGQTLKDFANTQVTAEAVSLVKDNRTPTSPTPAAVPLTYVPTADDTAATGAVAEKWFVPTGFTYELRTNSHQVVAGRHRTQGITRVGSGARLTIFGGHL